MCVTIASRRYKHKDVFKKIISKIFLKMDIQVVQSNFEDDNVLREIVTLVKDSFDQFSSIKEIAQNIKRNLDAEVEKYWHVIIGKSFTR